MSSTSKRKYKIVPSRSVFFDTDQTLIAWPEPGENFKWHPDAIELDLFGTKSFYVPMKENIEKLKEFYLRGYEIVVWSLSSKQWSEQVVKALGIEEYVDYCISKPDYIYDDKEVTDYIFKEKHLYHPFKG